MTTRFRFAARLAAAAVLVAGFGVWAAAQPSRADAARQRAERLKDQVKEATQQTHTATVRLAELQKRLEELQRKTKELPPPKYDVTPEAVEQAAGAVDQGPRAAPKADPKAEAKQVEFRLPLMRQSELSSKLGFVCTDQKVFTMDIAAINEALRGVITAANLEDFQRQGRGQKNWATVRNGPPAVRAGDFNVRVQVKENVTDKGPTVQIRIELVLKPGSAGETVEKALAPGSVFQTHLSSLDPALHNLQFAVFPDSHETFRRLREIAWKRQFTDIGWRPFHIGESITLGGGGVSVQ